MDPAGASDEIEGERKALDAAREARRQLRGTAARAREARKEVWPLAVVIYPLEYVCYFLVLT